MCLRWLRIPSVLISARKAKYHLQTPLLTIPCLINQVHWNVSARVLNVYLSIVPWPSCSIILTASSTLAYSKETQGRVYPIVNAPPCSERQVENETPSTWLPRLWYNPKMIDLQASNFSLPQWANHPSCCPLLCQVLIHWVRVCQY